MSDVVIDHAPEDNTNDSVNLSALGRRNNLSLATSIRDAEILMAYASQFGQSVEEEIIKVVVVSSSLYANGKMGDAEETQFWLAFNALSKKVSPVSVMSLQSILEPDSVESRSIFGMRLPKRSLARRAVQWYTFLAIATLFLLLSVQIYWLFGTSITNDIQKIADKRTDVSAKLGAMKAVNAISNGVTAKDEATNKLLDNSSSDLNMNALIAQEDTLELHLESSYEALRAWSEIWPKILEITRSKNASDPDKKIQFNAVLLQSSLRKIEVLQKYFLPLLYGLLGTCVYVLRSLSTEISARTYSEASNIGFRIRLYLGALGGMVIAWFIQPDTADGMFKSLSPFALAFLAGYSVEIVFSAMDRFLVAFTDKQVDKQATNRNAAT